MTAGFGGSPYTNPQTRALNSIANGPDADTTSQEKMVELLQKHSAQLRYLASNQKQMQQGINDANANPIQQLQQFVADVIVLLGGGELANGALDFGDLQYILPALGALFGFGDAPFPVSLFEAAQRFFLGYVVPQEQFVDVINSIITAWAGVFGIDPQFVADVRKLLEAFGNLFDGLNNLFPSLDQLFTALGISGADLGPLGQALAPIIKLFSGIDLTKFGSFIEFITDAIGPFIVQLTAVINFINGVLAVLGYGGGDVVNSPLPSLLQPFQNLISFLANINFFGDDFDPVAAVRQFVNTMLLPLNLLLGPDSPVNALNIFNQVPAALLGQVSFSSIGNLHPNLLTAGNFPNAASIADNPIWTFDPTVSRTGDGTGSAKVTANGTDRVLRSNLIGVSEGDTIDLSAWVKWSGLIFTGSPLQLSVRQFLGNAMVSDVAITSLAPGGSSGGFTQLSGTYTAPAGVDRVYTRVVVTGAATAGSVWYDDGSSNKTGLLQIPWMQNLPEAFDGVTSLFNLAGFADLIDGALDPSYVWTQIINSILLPLNLLTRQGDFTNLMANLGGGTATLAAIATRLQNIAAGGTIAGGAISGTITAPVQDVIDGFKNLSNTWFGGSSATGTPAEVATTVASIKSAVLSGWNVQIFTSSNSAWTVPSGTTQMKGCVICGGSKGQNGSATNATTASGGLGGSNGGYLSADLDLTGITAGSSTLNITVGAAATTAGADGGQSSIKFGATTLLAGAPNANGIATDQGLVGTTSQPGSGGNGGTGRDATTSDSGTKGEDSGVATGGAGGVGAAAGAGTGNAGSAGGAGTSASIPLCGGAGGGGGAGKGTGSSIQSVTGGTGGNGGFPGGGSGGGGGAANSGGGSRTGGSSGTPGNGLVAILYK